MIIAQRSASLSYGTDPVADSLSSFIAAPIARIAGCAEAETIEGAALDLNRLYPALFAPAHRPSLLLRSARALAVRLAVLGTGAALLVILHQI